MYMIRPIITIPKITSEVIHRGERTHHHDQSITEHSFSVMKISVKKLMKPRL